MKIFTFEEYIENSEIPKAFIGICPEEGSDNSGFIMITLPWAWKSIKYNLRTRHFEDKWRMPVLMVSQHVSPIEDFPMMRFDSFMRDIS